MNVLKLSNIRKSYQLPVLNDISFKITKGEIISIVGESGSGKSTLLNIIGGIDSDYSGEIYFEGKLLAKKDDLYRRNNVGFVFQNFNLISYLTAVDNVIIPILPKKEKLSKKRKRAICILEKLGMKEHANKYPNQLSGGQKQRVAIARALVNEPQILICDEPTGSLDSDNTNIILKIIKDIAKTGKTIIIATHSDEVSKISHRVIRLKDGSIEKEFTNNDFIEYYEEKKQNKFNNKLSVFSSLFLSLCNSKQKKTRTLLISIGTSIGILGLILILSLSNSIKTYINKTIKNSRNASILDVYKEKQEQKQTSLTFNDEDISIINKSKYTKNVDYGVSQRGSFIAFTDNGDISFEQISSYSDQLKKEYLLMGKFPKKQEVLLNNYLYYEVNQELSHISFDGVDYKISGVYEDGLSEKTIYFIYDDIKHVTNNKPNMVFVETNNINELKKEVIKNGYYLSYIEGSLKVFNETFDILIYVLAFTSAISLIVSSIMIMVVLYISVLERTKEIGILRALGSSSKDIKKMFKTDGILYGLLSGSIGILSSIPLLLLIDYYVFKNFNMRISSINIEYSVICFSISLIISIISSLYPSKKASKLNIIDALRYE